MYFLNLKYGEYEILCTDERVIMMTMMVNLWALCKSSVLRGRWHVLSGPEAQRVWDLFELMKMVMMMVMMMMMIVIPMWCPVLWQCGECKWGVLSEPEAL